MKVWENSKKLWKHSPTAYKCSHSIPHFPKLFLRPSEGHICNSQFITNHNFNAQYSQYSLFKHNRHTIDDVFEDFPKISEDFPKLFWGPNKHIQTFSKHFRTFSEDYVAVNSKLFT